MKSLLDLGIESPALKQYWWALLAFVVVAVIYIEFMPVRYINVILLATVVMGFIIGVLTAAVVPMWARKEPAAGSETSKG
jgi:hypothetical protein